MKTGNNIIGSKPRIFDEVDNQIRRQEIKEMGLGHILGKY